MQAGTSDSGNGWGIKIVCSLSFLSIAVALLIAWNSPAKGYELSIFASTPAIVWILLGASFCSGVVVVLRQAFNPGPPQTWWIGFLAIILVNLAVLMLNVVRGYLIYTSGDAVMHIGWSEGIVHSGHFGEINFYPALHVLVSQLARICGSSAQTMAAYLTPMLSVLFMMVCVYLLARVAAPQRQQALVAAAASSALLLNSLHITVYPHTFSYMLVPLALYLYLKGWRDRSWGIRASFIIALLIIPYSYPITAVMMIAFLAVMELTKLGYRRAQVAERATPVSGNPTLISSVAFFTWISSFYIFGATLTRLLSNLFDPLENPYVQGLQSSFEGLQPEEQARLFVAMYGDSAFYMVLWIMAGLLLMKSVRRAKADLTPLSALLAASAVSVPLQLIAFSGTRQVTVGRLANLNYVLVLAPVLAAFALFWILKNLRRGLAIGAASIFVIASWAIGLLGVYHSPWVFQESWQITRMEVQGAQWFLTRSDPTRRFAGLGYRREAPRLFAGGDGAATMRYRDPVLIGDAGFTALRDGTLGQEGMTGLYVLLTSRFAAATADAQISKARFYALMGWEFTRQSYRELESGGNVDKLYSNGEFDAYLARSVRRSL